MIKEFQAFFTLFQQGKQLTNSKLWKDRQNASNVLTAVFGAAVVVAGGFGYVVPVDQNTLAAAAGGIAALVGIVNAVLTTITSSKVGLPNKSDQESNS